MQSDIFPSSYEAWKHCITVKCQIELTKDFVEQRISVLAREESSGKGAFIDQYGPQWTQTTLGYFRRALREVSA